MAGLLLSTLSGIMSGWADLNRRPHGPEPRALAPALQPEKKTRLSGIYGSDGD
jgi:hypothetical protein